MAELIYIFLVIIILILIILKVKNTVYKFFFLFIVIIPIIPILLLIGSIRRVEYRKEFQKTLSTNVNYKIKTNNCDFNNIDILISKLLEVKPFVEHRRAPENLIELLLIDNSKEIKILLGSDTNTKEQLWIFYRGKLIGAFKSKEVYNIIYNGNCSKSLKIVEYPSDPY